jgi:hypothetical protein
MQRGDIVAFKQEHYEILIPAEITDMPANGVYVIRFAAWNHLTVKESSITPASDNLIAEFKRMRNEIKALR